MKSISKTLRRERMDMMIIKDYHQTIIIPIKTREYWSNSDEKDIEREMTDILIDLFEKAGRIEPKIWIVGFRRTRVTNRGDSGVGRFHKNWNFFENSTNIIEVKTGVKVT
jgi:hypothetical protein